MNFKINCFTFRKLVLVLFTLSIFYSGCSIQKVHQQSKEIESIGLLKGKVEVTNGPEGNVVVQMYVMEDGALSLKLQRIASPNNEFQFMLTPYTYYLAAYIDENNDRNYQPSEIGNYYGAPSEIILSENEDKNIGTITISEKMANSLEHVEIMGQAAPIWKNNGNIVKLNDPRFNRDNCQMGLWRPLDFFEQIGGGLFFLQEFDKDKMPIIFIHGVAGCPTDWKNVIKGLDKEQFQPWVVYYPSGIRLDVTTNFLTEAVNRIKTKYGIRDFAIVAHSMGGLICRSFVKKYIQFDTNNINDIKLVATISTPNLGLKSAASGVNNSPIVVPSWRDLTPDSEFISDLYNWEWPPEIPYHLIVTYHNRESDDGVVNLTSQASLKHQSESTRMYLFNDTHADILRNPDLVELINNLLKSPNK